MIRQELIDYIKLQLKKGRHKEDIKAALSSAKWQAQDIEDGLHYAESGIPLPPLPPHFSATSATESNPATLAGPSTILSEAWGIYRSNLKIFAGIVVVPMIAIALLAAIFFVGSLVLKIFANIDALGNVLNFSLGFVVILSVAVFIILLEFWSQIALITAIKDRNENISIAEAYRRAWHKIRSYFWVALLTGLITFGGFIFFVIPGIIFSLWFGFAAFIVIEEDLKGMNALLRSKAYASDYLFEIIWRFLFIGLVVFMISFGIGIVFGVPILIATILKAQLLADILNFLSYIVKLLVTPLTIIYSYLIYKHLKELKSNAIPVPQAGGKNWFMVAGIIGVLAIIGTFFLFLFTLFNPPNINGHRISAYKATLASMQGAVVMCCDNSENTLQTTSGLDICSSALGVKLPTSQQIYATGVTYNIAPNGTCRDEDPGLIVIPIGLPIEGCNVPATIRTSGVTFSPGC